MEPGGLVERDALEAVHGKENGGEATRSPSGSLICRMKWSKEFQIDATGS